MSLAAKYSEGYMRKVPVERRGKCPSPLNIVMAICEKYRLRGEANVPRRCEKYRLIGKANIPSRFGVERHLPFLSTVISRK
jgi:hypothetical protein